MKPSRITWLVLVVLVETVLVVCGQGMGYRLRGTLTSAGDMAGDPMWAIGKGFRIVASDPVLHHHLLALEGQEIMVTVVPATK